MSPTLARQDKLTRISPDQVLCEISGCGKVAAFILHRYLGPPKPAALAYCEDHVVEVAKELRVRIPGELT